MLEEVYIRGEAADAATEELRKSTSLKISRNSETGKLSATGKARSNSDKQLLKAINSSNVVVNVTATNNTNTSTGNLYVGGAFMGNSISTETTTTVTNNKPFTEISETYTTVTAQQEVNPGVLGKMSTANGKPGADMLHEVTEAYQGAEISLASGVSSPSSGPGSVYQTAHNNATKQSGIVTERIYDSSGNQMQMTPSGGYPSGVKSADWYVKDKNGNIVVIQRLK